MFSLLKQKSYSLLLPVQTGIPLSRRPTSRLPFEIQTLRIWPWYDLNLIYDFDLRHVKPI